MSRHHATRTLPTAAWRPMTLAAWASTVDGVAMLVVPGTGPAGDVWLWHAQRGRDSASGTVWGSFTAARCVCEEAGEKLARDLT